MHLWEYEHLRKEEGCPCACVWGEGGPNKLWFCQSLWAHQPHMRPHLHDVGVCPALVWLVILRVLEEHLVHVGAGVLEQLVGAVEDDQRDLTVAQHAQLVCLLHQPKFPLCKCHLGKREQQAGFLKKK